MIDVRNEIVGLLTELTGLDAVQMSAALEVPPAEMGDFALPCFKLAKALPPL